MGSLRNIPNANYPTICLLSNLQSPLQTNTCLDCPFQVLNKLTQSIHQGIYISSSSSLTGPKTYRIIEGSDGPIVSSSKPIDPN